MSKKITLVTGWYSLKSKFNASQYAEWISNMISAVNEANLVIYTNNESYDLVSTIATNKSTIKIVIKPMEEFFTYNYKDNWIQNHEQSGLLLHSHIDWQLNMLWSEKVFLVYDSMLNEYFKSEYYGWCDIGYFRNRSCDLNTSLLVSWPNTNKIDNFPIKIHYGCVQNNMIVYRKLCNDIYNHYNNNNIGPPSCQYDTLCFAGGFFFSHYTLIGRYAQLYNNTLQYYFSNKYVIKDDQTIIMDIIFNNRDLFFIHVENDIRYDNWFMFQRILS